MKNQFNLKEFMTANRNIIISKHNELSLEQFYNGITLRDFMIQIYNRVAENCKSEKTASKYLIYAIMGVYNSSVVIGGNDFKTENLKSKYQGTSYMSLV